MQREYKVKIVCIGNEILSGETLDTNSQFIAEQLTNMGIPVNGIETIADDLPTIIDNINCNAIANDLTIFTGGLGPTYDDITKTAIAKAFNCDLEVKPLLLTELAKRYGGEKPYVIEQATQPALAKILNNKLGSAPGLLFEQKNLVCFLPGVPHEMKSIFEVSLLPIIQTRFNLQPHLKHQLYFHQLAESKLNAFVHQLITKFDNISLGLYPKLSLVKLNLILNENIKTSNSASLQEFNQLVDTIKTQFANQLTPMPSLAESIQAICLSKKLTVATAESCSGGGVAAKLTAISGSSEYFLGSVVAYANSIKHKVLNVPKQNLTIYGAVSKETVSCMLQGVKQLMQSDYAVAVSGIAGPGGGSDTKPVGLVYIGVIDQQNKIHIKKYNFTGNRAIITKRAINNALADLFTQLYLNA